MFVMIKASSYWHLPYNSIENKPVLQVPLCQSSNTSHASKGPNPTPTSQSVCVCVWNCGMHTLVDSGCQEKCCDLRHGPHGTAQLLDSKMSRLKCTLQCKSVKKTQLPR